MNKLHSLITYLKQNPTGFVKYGSKLSKRFISNTKSKELTSNMYTAEEQSVIIETLQNCVENNIIRTHLNGKRLQSLKTVFDQNPNLKSLEPLLSASGFGPRLLHRICDSILHKSDKPPSTSESSLPRPYKYKPKNTESLDSATSESLGSLTTESLGYPTESLAYSTNESSGHSTPKIMTSWPSNLLTPHYINTLDGVKHTVSIHLGVGTASWARLTYNSTADLDHWDVCSLSSSLSVENKFDIHSIWEMALQLRGKIPDADVYVMENSNWSNVANVKKPMKQHIHDAMLTTALCSVFNQKDQGQNPRQLSDNRVYFLRNYTPARLFRKIIGTERVSAHDVVENMMEGIVDEKHQPISFTHEAKGRYRSLPGPLKDNMCQALLLGVSFTELILYNNPIALGILGKSQSKKRKKSLEPNPSPD